MIFFFFSSRRRHTRYIGDWSSDVCSSDLIAGGVTARAVAIEVADRHVIAGRADQGDVDEGPDRGTVTGQTQIGRASCRERVEITGEGGALYRITGRRQ